MTTPETAAPETESTIRSRASRIRAYWLSQGYDVVPSVFLAGLQWRLELPPFPNGCPPAACRVGHAGSEVARVKPVVSKGVDWWLK